MQIERRHPMTDRELRRLSRLDLLELLLTQQKENEQLRSLLDQAESRLADQIIQMNKVSPFTEASFRYSQESFQQCLESIRQLSEQQKMMCQKIAVETKERCDRMVAEAEYRAQQSWEKCSARILQLLDASAGQQQKMGEVSSDYGSNLHFDE